MRRSDSTRRLELKLPDGAPMPGFLDLPAAIVEQIAKVKLDHDIWPIRFIYRPKTYAFWILRELNHTGIASAVFQARHYTVAPKLENVARIGDLEWCHVLLDAHEHSQFQLDRALEDAAGFGHLEVVQLLHEAGANARGNNDLPLRAAAQHGQVPVVRMLLELGARADSNNAQPVYMAAQGGHAEVVGILLEKCALAGALGGRGAGTDPRV